MMNYNGYGMGPGTWVVGLIVLLLVGGVALLLASRSRSRGDGPTTGSGPALQLLKNRLAAGEITQDDYDKTRRVLEG